ncbi:MAG TPA: NfeD family protein [bacterium]|nr:NfeD family protein [bacterium]
MLFTPPALGSARSVSFAVGVAVCVGLGLMYLYVRRAIARSVRFAPLTGVESMAGRDAVVVTPLRPAGTIRYQGEFWRAAAGRPIEQGVRVRIIRVERQPEGLTVIVEETSSPLSET